MLDGSAGAIGRPSSWATSGISSPVLPTISGAPTSPGVLRPVESSDSWSSRGVFHHLTSDIGRLTRQSSKRRTQEGGGPETCRARGGSPAVQALSLGAALRSLLFGTLGCALSCRPTGGPCCRLTRGFLRGLLLGGFFRASLPLCWLCSFGFGCFLRSGRYTRAAGLAAGFGAGLATFFGAAGADAAPSSEDG